MTDLVATPSVQAGGDVTVTLRANHPAGIASVQISVLGPNGERIPRDDVGAGTCQANPSSTTYVMSEPGIDAEISAECMMPTNATNGTWQLSVRTQARGAYVPTTVTVPFEVVGGVDDQGAPVVTALLGPPAAAAAGSTFLMAFRIEDGQLTSWADTSPANFAYRVGGESLGGFYCVDHVTTWVSPTVIETSMTCNVPPGQRPGPYTVEFLWIEDLFGLKTNATFGPVQVTP